MFKWNGQKGGDAKINWELVSEVEASANHQSKSQAAVPLFKFVDTSKWIYAAFHLLMTSKHCVTDD